MVVEEGVGDGDPVGAVVDVKETVIVVLAVLHVRREVAVIDPDILGGLDVDGIAAGGLDLLDGEVADDDVLLLLDVQTDTLELGTSGTYDSLVRANTDLGASGDGALDDDNQGLGGLSSGGEL